MISNKFPKITVIIPVYNVECYLPECVDSVLNQDYSNKEILIINDGSTDGCSEIINKYKKNNICISVVETENRGLSMARNLGMELALGDFLLFLDGDDYLLPNTLSSCSQAAFTHNVDIVMFSGEIINSSINSKNFPNSYYIRPFELLDKPFHTHDLFEKLISLKKYIPSACLYMFKKDKFKGVDFYPKILFEDNLFTTKLLLHFSDSYAVCIPDLLYKRRIREGSITTQEHTLHHLNSYRIVIEELLKINFKFLKVNTRMALEIFIQKIIVGYLETSLKLSNAPKVKFIRFKLFGYLRQLELNNIKFLTIILLIFPWFIPIFKRYNYKKFS